MTQHASPSRFSSQGRLHPWHGISPYGSSESTERAPEVVRCFIEMVPRSDVKLELDKESGYLLVDRPQKFSNFLPCLYGFIPQTYSHHHVAQHTNQALPDLKHPCTADEDPLDICVLTDRQLLWGDILVDVRIVGGLRMLDTGEADDKILAVLCDDALYGSCTDVHELPATVLQKIKHYFLTYKEIPSTSSITPKVEITHTYGAAEARTIIALARKDYYEAFRDTQI